MFRQWFISNFVSCVDDATCCHLFLRDLNHEPTQSIDLVIQIIINHYTSIKTSELAEELFFGIRRKEPTALFVARLFGYMCKSKKFLIDKKSTDVEEI